MKRQGILFVLTGPSGVGKSTIREQLIANLGLVYSISATTRSPRPGEQDGVDYQFISKEEFERRVAHGEFIEWAWVFGRGYGTPKEPLLREIAQQRDVLLEIDVQGASQVRGLKESLPTTIYYIFVLPPSLRALKERQSKRASDTPEEINKRVQQALREISHAHEFDLVVINDNLDDAVRVISEFVQAAREAC